MRISNYYYNTGRKPSKRLRKAVTWLNKNKKRIVRQFETLEDCCYFDINWSSLFDYPDYLGLPRSIVDKLSSDEVDWLQSQIYDWQFE